MCEASVGTLGRIRREKGLPEKYIWVCWRFSWLAWPIVVGRMRASHREKNVTIYIMVTVSQHVLSPLGHSTFTNFTSSLKPNVCHLTHLHKVCIVLSALAVPCVTSLADIVAIYSYPPHSSCNNVSARDNRVTTEFKLFRPETLFFLTLKHWCLKDALYRLGIFLRQNFEVALPNFFDERW